MIFINLFRFFCSVSWLTIIKPSKYKHFWSVYQKSPKSCRSLPPFCAVIGPNTWIDKRCRRQSGSYHISAPIPSNGPFSLLADRLCNGAVFSIFHLVFCLFFGSCALRELAHFWAFCIVCLSPFVCVAGVCGPKIERLADLVADMFERGVFAKCPPPYQFGRHTN